MEVRCTSLEAFKIPGNSRREFGNGLFLGIPEFRTGIPGGLAENVKLECVLTKYYKSSRAKRLVQYLL